MRSRQTPRLTERGSKMRERDKERKRRERERKTDRAKERELDTFVESGEGGGCCIDGHVVNHG